MEFFKHSPPNVYAPVQSNGCSPQDLFEEYQREYTESISNPDKYWDEKAKKYLSWFSPYHTVRHGTFGEGDIAWFLGGKLNACYNCVDRHLPARAQQDAIIWEGDEIGESRRITYGELHREVCRVANILKKHGVRKGDVVTIYMPMVPELAYTMLACARLGAIHSVVFAGFSADSLRDRIMDCHSQHLVISNIGRRGGKVLDFHAIADKALQHCQLVHPSDHGTGPVNKLFLFRYPGSELNTSRQRSIDVCMDEELQSARPYCPCEAMDSEDTSFILYTSGSTGKPKGVAHSIAGYLLGATMTTSRSFDIRDNANDVYCCVADCGWITGHSYVVYGPLSLGTTTMMFESVPTYPHPYRYWDLIQRHKVTQFYTAPTAIRALMRFSTEEIGSYDLSSLRVLGTVGEPINPEAWKWYYTHAGREKCTVVDTYWQTETGSHLACNIPGIVPMKPGSCTVPCCGIEFAILDPTTGQELTGPNVEGVLAIKQPFPSIARTVYNDHSRYLQVYMKPYNNYYFTGDGARRDADHCYFITGRVDDVINPSGHRIGTAEVESALIGCEEVSESAVIGFPHDLKGEGIGCYVILKAGIEGSAELSKKLTAAVREAIGPIATPDFIIYCDLPKTRSGKIMRRILRKISAGEEDSIGDTSTLADPSVVERLIAKFRETYRGPHNKPK